MRSTVLRVIYTSVTLLALAGLGLADTIRLKDGSIIKGNIISFTNGSFVIEIGSGSHRRELTFAASEVRSITFDSQSSPAVVTNRNASYSEPERKPEPKPETPPAAVTSAPDPQPASPPAKMAPIGWNVRVTADNTSNGWTNTGWVVRKGQRIRITGAGQVSLGKGQQSTPAGLASLEDGQKLLKSVPTGALIAVIGDDNNDFIYVGSSREFTATRDGALFLGINEGNLEDNSGAFNVKVEVMPDEAS